ncbi:MAG TPA: FMN-binding protein [Jatrophihabitantaceae bacterium]|nr:FMN-binding protein [Jatrophihabitantaceae bacterium]
MKRVLLSVTATILGLVALLGYKTHGQVTTASSGLPSASLPGGSSTTAPADPGSTSSVAPPDPTASTTTASSPTAASGSVVSGSAASTFTGAAESTPYGVVQVRITVVGKTITNVAFAQLTAFDDRSQRINSGAAPILLQETLSAQSANIDSVSGASYTSQGYQQSLQSALDQAGI